MRHIFLITVLIVPASCWAEMYDADYQRCNQQNTTVSIVDCVADQAKQWDKRLNHSYSALKKRIDAPQHEALTVAQRLWVKYRDANCGFYESAEGSIRQIEGMECRRAMTKARTCELQAASAGDGGPGPGCR